MGFPPYLNEAIRPVQFKQLDQLLHQGSASTTVCQKYERVIKNPMSYMPVGISLSLRDCILAGHPLSGMSEISGQLTPSYAFLSKACFSGADTSFLERLPVVRPSFAQLQGWFAEAKKRHLDTSEWSADTVDWIMVDKQREPLRPRDSGRPVEAREARNGRP